MTRFKNWLWRFNEKESDKFYMFLQILAEVYQPIPCADLLPSRNRCQHVHTQFVDNIPGDEQENILFE